jgi:5-formyltetrahydrofolate cyclo-ligase
MVKLKQEIRDAVLSRRSALDPDWVDEHSLLVERAVTDLQEFASARVVACYVAMPGEVRVDAIVEQCWQENRMVCVPAFRPEIEAYALARIDRDSDMVLGLYDILEPADHDWVSVDRVDLMLVPGLAFDLAGGRVGHGKGYYDRILEGAAGNRPAKIGLAFEFQVFEQVPTNSSDVKMDMVVTESRLIRV